MGGNQPPTFLSFCILSGLARTLVALAMRSSTGDFMKKYEVPMCDKYALTLEEAAAYYNIGVSKLRELTNDDRCKFVLWVGNKRLIKKDLFNQYLNEMYSV